MAETEWEESRKSVQEKIIEFLHSTPLEVFSAHSINLVMGKASTLHVGGSISSYCGRITR